MRARTLLAVAALFGLSLILSAPARGGVPRVIVAEHFGDCC